MKFPGCICLLFSVFAWLPTPSLPAAEPVFLARTASGKVIRGPLHKLTADWSIEIGKGVRRKISGSDLVSLQRVGSVLPPMPSDEHLILANGDRLPVQDLRLADEKLSFRHKDLAGDKELSVPLSSVVLIWRTAPDRVVVPERFRKQVGAAKRSHDRVLLRNGDTLEGTLNSLGADTVEIEVNKKTTTARWAQVAAIALSTELTDRLRPKGAHARVVLAEGDGSPGGRITLTSASLDGGTLRGKTAFNALVRIPLDRVIALQILGGKSEYLSDLKPIKYEYRPYLDEKWSWSADGNVMGRELRLAGSTFDKGISMHSHSLITWKLDGGYKRFEALVGLDDHDGRKGRALVKVLLDGKSVDLGKKGTLTHARGPFEVSLALGESKTLTLEVENAGEGLVQGVVDWVDARLVK